MIFQEYTPTADAVAEALASGGGVPPSVVLLHGIGQQRASWDSVARHLVAMGHRVLVPDMTAEHHAGKTFDRETAVTLDALAAHVEALVDALHLGAPAPTAADVLSRPGVGRAARSDGSGSESRSRPSWTLVGFGLGAAVAAAVTARGECTHSPDALCLVEYAPEMPVTALSWFPLQAAAFGSGHVDNYDGDDDGAYEAAARALIAAGVGGGGAMPVAHTLANSMALDPASGELRFKLGAAFHCTFDAAAETTRLVAAVSKAATAIVRGESDAQGVSLTAAKRCVALCAKGSKGSPLRCRTLKKLPAATPLAAPARLADAISEWVRHRAKATTRDGRSSADRSGGVDVAVVSAAELERFKAPASLSGAAARKAAAARRYGDSKGQRAKVHAAIEALADETDRQAFAGGGLGGIDSDDSGDSDG